MGLDTIRAGQLFSNWTVGRNILNCFIYIPMAMNLYNHKREYFVANTSIPYHIVNCYYFTCELIVF